MKKLVVGLLLVVLVVLAVGCGSAATEDATSPSASPSPSPTVLTDADLLTQFLADVKPVRVRYHRLSNQLDHLIWTDAHKTADSSWPPVGRKMWKLLPKYDGIMVDLQLIDTPDFMRPAMKNLLTCLRRESAMYDSIAGWMRYKEGWGAGSANGQRYEKMRAAWGEASDAWRIKVKLEAKRYGVRIPWKWTN